MTPQAQALYSELLAHHAHVCENHHLDPPHIDACVIPYGVLCSQAGVPELTRRVGDYLLEIARYCHSRGWPPINSLAVNVDTRMPGDSYDVAPGCSLLE